MPVLTTYPTFDNNFASYYGNDIASYAITLVTITEEEYLAALEKFERASLEDTTQSADSIGARRRL